MFYDLCDPNGAGGMTCLSLEEVREVLKERLLELAIDGNRSEAERTIAAMARRSPRPEEYLKSVEKQLSCEFLFCVFTAMMLARQLEELHIEMIYSALDALDQIG